MNFSTHTIGDASDIKERFGSENTAIRPVKLLNVLCFNDTGAEGDGGALYLQVHEIAPGPAGAVAPIDTSVPKFSFPVFSKTGGMLGQQVDLTGVYCCWSTTEATKTLVAANSGSIIIVLKA